ncbi:uncharacterized protein JCM10292_006259 [Rhodotorula paludigena]|uniref:uncharacterized protein n=1 Tax=Rhodotorula paludigena TaxID=86838 RepID=UPI0031723DFA
MGPPGPAASGSRAPRDPSKASAASPPGKHCVPVESPLSAPSTVPPKESNVQSRPLTTPQSRSAPISDEALLEKKQARRKKQRDRQNAVPEGDEGFRGRTIVASGSSGPAATRAPASYKKTNRPKKGRKKGLPSQSATFDRAHRKDKKAEKPAPTPSEGYAAVKQGDQIAFTRSRSDALNSSIASVLGAAPPSVLGARPAEVLQQHDRETRTKRQKTAADEFRRRLMMDLDVDDEGETAEGEVAGGEMFEQPTEEEKAQQADAEWVDADDDETDLLVESAQAATPPSPHAHKSAHTHDTNTPTLAQFSTLPVFPPSKPFTFPQPAHKVETPKTAFPFSFTVAQPTIITPALTRSLPHEAHGDPVAHSTGPAVALPPQPPSSPSPSIALVAPASASPNDKMVLHTEAVTAQPASNPFASLPKALPLPAGKQPKPSLRSAAGVLAGKKRKSKKLKRLPQLFDFFSDEESDDWEDIANAKMPKRPRNGRAVDGKLDDEGTEGHVGEEQDGAEDRMKSKCDILPETRARAEKLMPLSYQSALLERAKEGNVVTVMPTGSGKTLVAVLLIEWIHSVVEAQRIASGEPKRMQFFLTQSVPLVHQQANILAHNTSLRVGKLFGALGVNLCSASEWKFNFENYDCLVVTAQLILDSLAHGFLKMDQIALLVFDEAHHAKSNHPFASILRDFYHRSPAHKRPRILGLTASPLEGSEGMDEARKLERLFDAKLVTAPPETQAELRAMVAKPTLLQVEYSKAPQYDRTELLDLVVSKVVVQDDTFKRHLAGAETALVEYGPDASDLVWHLALERYKHKFLPVIASPSASDDNPADEVERELLGMRMDVEGVGENEKRQSRIERRKEENKQEKARMKRELEQKMMDELNLELPDWLEAVEEYKVSLEYERLSPKLQKLLDILKACKIGANDFCGIVFVNRRLDALLIAQIIKEFVKLDSDLAWIRVDCVTGHGTGANNSLGPRMAWHEQASVLTGFGEGSTNLLIATSVVEEGLDVQPCNFVVRFDLYDTHVSFIQSRGRARAAGSHYLLFIEKGNLEQKKKLLRIARLDQGMFDLLNGDRDEAELDDETDFFGRAEEKSVVLEEPSTGAVLTPHFSLSLLQRYTSSLPKADEFSVSRPQYEINDYGRNEFGARSLSCTITLPSSSKVRVVTGPLCESAKLAKRQAAYTACKVLRAVDCLDEHFLPPRTLPPDEIVDVVTGAAIGSKKRQIEYERKVPDCFVPTNPFDCETTCFATLLHYSGDKGETTFSGQLYRPIVLLTRNPLPNIPPMTMFVLGEALEVHATAIGAIQIGDEEREVLTGYSLQLWQAVLNKILRVARVEIEGKEGMQELDLVYFVALLKDDVHLKENGIDLSDIDWSGMKHAARVKEERIDWRDLSKLEDSVVVDLAKNQCRYNFEGVHNDLHPFDKLPPGRQSDAGFDTLMDYYLSFSDNFFHAVNVVKEQPLLEISRMPKTTTHLTRTPRNDVAPTAKKLTHKLKRFAIPQTCLKHFLPASIFRTAYMLPSIMSDLEQRCLIVELNERIFGGKLDEEHVRTALMTPSASVGLDYNRLELLGDAFLKYMSSTYCYVSHERTTHEGILHRARLEQINNHRLYEAGKACNVPSYLVSRPFTSRQFLPPNFTQLSPGPAPPSSAVIGDKTIADAVEALLGAAIETGFAHGGLNKAFDFALEAAKSLGLELGNITVWDDFARLYGPPGIASFIEGDLVDVEKALGYSFKHAELVVEAFTHPSKLDAVSFERCEWLGDSVLDFHVVKYCWARWGGELSAGHLTELKGGCVSNETLAALAIELNLDRFLIHEHDGLAINMRLYRERIEQARERESKEAEQEQRQLRPYWLTLDPPKAVADIIESLFGALYLDSCFDPAAAQQSFDHMLVPFYAKWISPTSLKVDAIRVLLEHAQSSGCEDVSHVSSMLEPRMDNKTGELIQRLTRCSVVAHNMVIGSVEAGNAKTAKRLASAEALSYLNQNPGFFPHVCDCSSRREIAREIALEEQERLRAEGLLSEVESDEEELGPLEEGKSDEAVGDVHMADNDEANGNIVAEGE